MENPLRSFFCAFGYRCRKCNAQNAIYNNNANDNPNVNSKNKNIYKISYRAAFAWEPLFHILFNRLFHNGSGGGEEGKPSASDTGRPLWKGREVAFGYFYKIPEKIG